MKIRLFGAALAALSLAACGSAGPSQNNESSPATSQTRSENDDAKTHSADGTVEKIDAGHVTIVHGPVPTMQWPAMTMAFSARDAALLDGIQPGDRVAFSFSKSGGGYALTAISKK